MKLISKVFSPRKAGGGPSGPPSNLSSELTSSDIETYYLRVIVDCLRRMLVPAENIEVGVKRSGTGAGGLPAYAGYVRLLKWDPVLTPVLLQNMPVIDARVRKVVQASVLLEHTQFNGLWFQATAQTQGAPQVLVGLPIELVHQPRGAQPPPPRDG